MAEDAATWTSVGLLSAGDAVTYHITSGNGARTFAIDLNRGDIWLMKALDYEAVSTYTLTVEARDRHGSKDSTTVTITVTDVAGK